MMTTEFIKGIERKAIYNRKPDTKTAFYFGEGRRSLLPYRISVTLSGDGFKRITQTGRALQFIKRGEVRAVFTNSEHGSPYQLLPKGSRMHFSLWEAEEHPFLVGFSSIGRTNANDKMEDTKDLVVALGDSDTMEFRVYPGAYEDREAIFTYLRSEVV